MRSESGEFVDLYIPRKCSVSNRIIGSNSRGVAQINVAKVDENGVAVQGVHSFIIADNIHKSGDSDASLHQLFADNNIVCVEGSE